MSFERALQLFETARKKTGALVSGLSQQQMDFTPRAGRWSIGEIVDHLLLSEKVYRDQIARLIALAKEGKETVLQVTVQEVNFAPFFVPKSLLPVVETPFALMTRFVPTVVTEFMIRYPFLPGQNPDVARPAKGRPADTLRQELAASIHETRTLFMSNAELDYRHMIARHPMIGANNVPELLRILALHEERHHGQISGVRDSVRFPKAVSCSGQA